MSVDQENWFIRLKRTFRKKSIACLGFYEFLNLKVRKILMNQKIFYAF